MNYQRRLVGHDPASAGRTARVLAADRFLARRVHRDGGIGSGRDPRGQRLGDEGRQVGAAADGCADV
jgi:hypothetical protein